MFASLLILACLQNAPPGQPTVTLVGSTGVGQPIEIAWTGRDPNDDLVTADIRWTVGGVDQPTKGTVYAEAPSRGTPVTVSVVLSDGKLESSAGVLAFEIDNTPPQPPEVVVAPLPAIVKEALVCAAPDPFDADGDDLSVTYRWDQVYSALDEPLAQIVSDTIPIGTTRVDDTWQCTATVSDGAAAASSTTGPIPIEKATNLVPGPNFLIVLLDDVGVDSTSTYGLQPDAPLTPSLDALASEGLLFRNAYAHPGCSSTRAALLTGRYPSRTGIGSAMDYYEETTWLSEGELSLADLLAVAPVPYMSGMFGKWHLVADLHPSPSTHPTEFGFSTFKGTLDNLQVTITPSLDEASYFNWELNDNGVINWTQDYATTRIVDEAINFMADAPQPWFSLVALHAAHDPNHIPPAELVPNGVPAYPLVQRDYYVPMVESADTELGRLLSHIPEDSIENTWIIVLGDNGTPEESVLPPFDPERSKTTVFDGGTKVPMVVAGPLIPTPGSETEALVHVVDLLPTLAHLSGISLIDPPDVAADVAVDGASLVPVLLDPAATAREALYNERFSPNGDPATAIQHHVTARNATHRYIIIRDVEQLYEYAEGVIDEGEDLLLSGVPLTEDQQANLDSLRVYATHVQSGFIYEGL